MVEDEAKLYLMAEFEAKLSASSSDNIWRTE